MSKRTDRPCPVCDARMSDGWVLYQSAEAAASKDASQREVVCGRCVPADAVRVSSFAFALAKGA